MKGVNMSPSDNAATALEISPTLSMSGLFVRIV
jgi:hypothetical protein